MGIWKRKYPSGRVAYQVKFKDSPKESFSTKRAAQEKLAELRKEDDTERALGIKIPKKILFESFCEEYLRWSEKNKRSYKRDKSLIKNLLARFKGKKLGRITPHLIEQYKMDRQKEVEKSTINRELSALRTIFNKAILWDKFRGDNPMKKINFYPELERTRFLTEPEMEKFYEALYHKDTPGMIRNICLCALNTGMRKEEILSLRWTDVNFKDKTIIVIFTKDNRVKVVSIIKQLENVLLDIPQYKDCPYIFSHNLRGKRIRYNDIKKAFKGILQRAGIEGFRFHDLRHTCASYLRKAGVDLSVIMKVLGHRNIKTTLRYTHIFDKEISDALSRLEFVYPQAPVKDLGVKSGVEQAKKSQNSQQSTTTPKLEKDK